MRGTIASTTPYRWPYDGAFDPDRAALLVVTAGGAPTPPAQVAAVGGALRGAGGVVVQVTTAPPRRHRAPQPEPVHGADFRVEAHGVDGFFASPLDAVLRDLGRDQLLLCGGWLETSVHSTLRSANDRGYECLLVLDACTAFADDLLPACRSQIEMSGGIFGAVGATADVLAAIRPSSSTPERTTP